MRGWGLFADPDEMPSDGPLTPRLSSAFSFAFAGHLLLLALFLLVPSSVSSSRPSELKMIRRALSEMMADPVSPGPAPAAGDPDTVARALAGSIRFSDEADLKKKVEIVKAMIRSFSRAGSEREGSYFDLSKLSLDEIQAKIEEGVIRLPDGEKVFSAKSGEAGHALEFHTLSREDEDQVSRLARKRSKETGSEAGGRDPSRPYFVPPEIYYRECPYANILAWGPSLFTVVGGIPEFITSAGVTKAAAPVSRPATASPPAGSPALTVFIVGAGESPSPDAEAAVPESTDVFSPAGMAGRLDDLMKKPEAEQWIDFQRDYLDRYDPDSPELASFTRLFIASNLNGIFYTADRFAEAYDSLEELYYKRPIYDALLAYARRHPGTRTTAEILFSLASAYDFEKRTLALVDEIGPPAAEILENGVPVPEAFDYQVKAYVLKRMSKNMRAAFTRNGQVRIDVALKKYRQASLDIYRHLAASTGDIRDRALFTIGTTYWEDGDFDQAFAFWRKVRPSYDSPVYRFIRPYLSFKDANLPVAREEIRRYLTAQTGDENGNHLHRHLRFHKWAIRAKSLARPHDAAN